MKATSAALSFLTALVLSNAVQAQNHSERTPITMEQLMEELRIQGGNFTFSFGNPVFARVTTIVSSGAKPEEKETFHFNTAAPNKSITLFFSASALFVGDYQKPGQRFDRKMLVKLSDCEATAGTRVIHYQDRLTGNYARYSPAVPAVPEVGKQYVLHWYFQEGDPYYAKAVIEFSETAFQP